MPSARKLAKAGDVPSLISMLQGDKDRDAAKAAEALADFDDPAATDALVRTVVGRDANKVRRAAAAALICKEKETEHRRALVELLEDDELPKRLRRDVALALAVPPHPDTAGIIARLVDQATPVRTQPFGIGTVLHVAPTLHLFPDPWRELAAAQLRPDETPLFVVHLSDTVGCVALEDRWIVLTNPRGAFTGLQAPFGHKAWIVRYEDSLPLDFRVEGGEYVAFIRGSQHLRFAGFDVQGAVKQARPFFEWLGVRHAAQ